MLNYRTARRHGAIVQFKNNSRTWSVTITSDLNGTYVKNYRVTDGRLVAKILAYWHVEADAVHTMAAC